MLTRKWRPSGRNRGEAKCFCPAFSGSVSRALACASRVRNTINAPSVGSEQNDVAPPGAAHIPAVRRSRRPVSVRVLLSRGPFGAVAIRCVKNPTDRLSGDQNGARATFRSRKRRPVRWKPCLAEPTVWRPFTVALNANCCPSGEIAPRSIFLHVASRAAGSGRNGPAALEPPTVSATAVAQRRRGERGDMQPPRPSTAPTPAAPVTSADAGVPADCGSPSPESTAAAVSRHEPSATDQPAPSRGSSGRRGRGRAARAGPASRRRARRFRESSR